MNGNCVMTDTATIRQDEEIEYNREKNRENILTKLSTSFDAMLLSSPNINIFETENIYNIKTSPASKSQSKNASHKNNNTKEGRTKNTHTYTYTHDTNTNANMNTNNSFANDGLETLGNIIEKKKKGRKTKKPSEKEIMMQYSNTYGSGEHDHLDSDSNNNNNDKKRKSFDYSGVLSAHERNEMEKRMTNPINENQQEYVNALKNKQKKIIVVSGPAGTGKTLFATEYGIRYFLTGTYEKLIFTRPSVAVDEELGFLPGTLEEKMAPWIRPIFDVLFQFISPKEVQLLIEEKIIEIAPLGFMRGRTFKNCWIVADEMQNSTVSQMKMLLTRVGNNSRLVITGDLEQFDRTNQMNGLEDFLNKFRGRRSSSISNFEFNTNDIQREDVVKEILDIYSNNEVPKQYFEPDNGENEDTLLK